MANGRRPDAPLVFIEKAKNALRIAAACPEALALGLGPGLALADARARVPELLVIDHDSAGDDRLIEKLADWCDRYTPMVAPDPPYGVMLDLTGCAVEADAIATDIERQGFTLLYAESWTPDRARALARYPQSKAPPLQGRGWGGVCPPEQCLQTGTCLTHPTPKPSPSGEGLDIPTAALELDADRATALRRAGLTTIADLAARPRAVLAARFGEAMTGRLARILGEEDVRITPRRPPPALFVSRRFAEPVGHADYVRAALSGLVAQAAEELDRRGEGGRSFIARLYRSDGAIHMLGIATGTPTRDPQLVMRLFTERIETLADPLDPGFGYDALRLDVPVTEKLDVAQLGLDRGQSSEAEAAALLDRIGIRLGADRIGRFVQGDSHIPELAASICPSKGRGGIWPTPEPGEPPSRPLHLFNPPQLIEVVAEVPDGPPRRFRWRRQMHNIARYEGPERIAAEWWKRRDGKGLTRDYYRVEDSTGRRFWVFRHGLYGGEAANPGWYLHGVFV